MLIYVIGLIDTQNSFLEDDLAVIDSEKFERVRERERKRLNRKVSLACISTLKY